jgi:hypothetical protein
MAKLKIGVFGSAAGDLDTVAPKARALGEVLSRYVDQIILITGASTGIPYEVIKICAANGVEIWGYSKAFDLEGQKAGFVDVDSSIFTKIMYVPKDFVFADNERVRLKYRNVISTASCDGGIILSGRWGTVNEFTNLVDMQKVIGVLTGTGGIADELPALSQKISKEGQGKIIFDDDPKALVEALLSELESVKTD